MNIKEINPDLIRFIKELDLYDDFKNTINNSSNITDWTEFTILNRMARGNLFSSWENYKRYLKIFELNKELLSKSGKFFLKKEGDVSSFIKIVCVEQLDEKEISKKISDYSKNHMFPNIKFKVYYIYCNSYSEPLAKNVKYVSGKNDIDFINLYTYELKDPQIIFEKLNEEKEKNIEEINEKFIKKIEDISNNDVDERYYAVEYKTYDSSNIRFYSTANMHDTILTTKDSFYLTPSL